jgi:hypothetical protein
VGLLTAVDAALTLGLGAALWFLVFLLIPIVIGEIVVAMKLVAGKAQWYYAVPLIVLLDYAIGVPFLDGILAPLAQAYLLVNTALLVVWILGLASSLRRTQT